VATHPYCLPLQLQSQLRPPLTLLRFRRRHREKPKLVTLCDVSDSVRNASRFMLQLVWSLQDCFSRVRSYVFVSEIAEVTQAFNTYPVDTAIDWALKSSSVDCHCRSDFGYAFNRFVKTELETLDRKTTVLILGDARNNYNDPQAWAIRQIRERVKGVIWLNPEGQWGWGIGDSVMPLYSPACDIVKECRTVGQLVQVVDQLEQATGFDYGTHRCSRIHAAAAARSSTMAAGCTSGCGDASSRRPRPVRSRMPRAPTAVAAPTSCHRSPTANDCDRSRSRSAAALRNIPGCGLRQSQSRANSFTVPVA